MLGIRTHTVRWNQTLEDISEEWYGDRKFAMFIYRHNSRYLMDPNSLSVGMKLVIPHLPLKNALQETLEGHFGRS